MGRKRMCCASASACVCVMRRGCSRGMRNTEGMVVEDRQKKRRWEQKKAESVRGYR